jgi:hypothetical protein
MKHHWKPRIFHLNNKILFIQCKYTYKSQNVFQILLKFQKNAGQSTTTQYISTVAMPLVGIIQKMRGSQLPRNSYRLWRCHLLE